MKSALVAILCLIVIVILVLIFADYNINEDCLTDQYNCDDFNTQEEAQKVFDQCDTDVHKLDLNNDGIACESLTTK